MKEPAPIDLNLLIDFSETMSEDLKIAINVHEGKTKPSDFRILKKLAKGGYGEVYVVEKDSAVYAMKKVSKQLVLRNPNTTFFMNEKKIMTTHGSEWLVKSHMCIQDASHIYYVMEFVHGGDLMGYLSKKDVMREDEIRFYAAEIITAIKEMHSSGWIHRDLKPDNILLDRNGHVKLADFGSCAMLENGKVVSNTTVGTPDYISPDVLSSVGEMLVYGPEIDYWTIGVILYEMFYGITPFYSSSLKETYSKITNIDFKFEDGISDELKDLICRLICKKEDRFTFKKIKDHPFFRGIDWDSLRESEPPFKPSVSGDEDISNFVDTEFTPDALSVKLGFTNFIGFTHDPEHVARIMKLIGVSFDQSKPVAEVCLEDMKNDKICFEDMRCDGLKDISREAECKSRELEEIKAQLNTLAFDKKELASQLSTLQQNLQSTILQLSAKKDTLAQIQSETQQAREELLQIKADISEKARVTVENIGISGDLRDLKKMIDRFGFQERLGAIQESAYWFYKQNQLLVSEVNALTHTEGENKSLEELKKQLRLQRSEIREYEQKIENEVLMRKKLEDEIKALKKSLKEASRSFNNFFVKVMNALTANEIDVHIENGTIKVDGQERLINTVFVRELKNNELHHLPYKKRALCLQMHFLNEPVKYSSSSGSRRSLKVLEADLEKEGKILQGLEKLVGILEGESKEEAEMQIKGSTKKIIELKQEIERAKKSTITDFQVDDCENAHEFNSHLFYEKTVAKGTLCDHCNEVLYGIVNQAYCCKDCLLVVHKSCYVLVDVSCELNRAIKAGTSIPVVCKTIEDKDKLLNLNKII